MRTLDLLHRWTGGLIGLVLALLGLTGTILVHKHAWIGLPHAGDPQAGDLAIVATATERLLAEPGAGGIIYASRDFGLHQLRFADGAGLYADQAGDVVSRWSSQWDRPELWLFDLHHHLLTGDVGETVIGTAGLAALFFTISGAILWWRTRSTFRLRLWPKRLSRPAIVTHHRNLGIVVAPLIVLSALTGTMMVFRPVGEAVVAPLTGYGAVSRSLTPPKVVAGPLAERADWSAMLAEARRRYPDGEFRILTLPRKPGEPVTLRMRRAAEWLPNGRTTLWFDGATGRLLAHRDALAMPAGAQAFNLAYPLHAAKVGGLAWRLVMTVSGVALTLLGTLAVWSFWFRRPAKRSSWPAAPLRPGRA